MNTKRSLFFLPGAVEVFHWIPKVIEIPFYFCFAQKCQISGWVYIESSHVRSREKKLGSPLSHRACPKSLGSAPRSTRVEKPKSQGLVPGICSQGCVLYGLKHVLGGGVPGYLPECHVMPEIVGLVCPDLPMHHTQNR